MLQDEVGSLVDVPTAQHEHLLASFFIAHVETEELLEFDELDGVVYLPLRLLQCVHAVLDRDVIGENASHQTNLVANVELKLSTIESASR